MTRVRRRSVRAAALVAATLATGAGVAAFAPTAAEAVSQIQTGYWSALPAAPQVPSGGFEIGSNASGAHAVAAIRFTLAQGESLQQLNLKVNYAQPADQVAVSACPVAAKSDNWQPPSGGGPGAISSAPAADCSNGIVGGSLSTDGSTLTFDLSLLNFTGPTVDLLLEPSQVGSPAAGLVPGSPQQTYPSFDSTYDPVTAAQIFVVTHPTPPSSQGPAPVTQPAPVSQPAPAPQSGGGAAPVSLPPASTDSGAAAAAPPVVAPTQQSTPAAQALPVIVKNGRNWRLLFAIAMLSSDLLFGLLWLQNRQPAAGERQKLSIYDPPPVAPRPAEPVAN